MSATIHKVVLSQTTVQDISLPDKAEILKVDVQHNKMCLWYRFEETNHKDVRRIMICGTGHPAPLSRESRYIGTVLLHGGVLVLHVFELVS